MNQLMKISLDYRRMGILEGQWVCTKERWDKFIEEYKDETLHLYDILGKHSCIQIKIKDLAENVIIATNDQSFLSKARELNIDLNSGWNPLDYDDELGDIKYNRLIEEGLIDPES